MGRWHALVAVVVGLALVGGAEAAPKAKKKGKKSETALVHGTVEAVHHDGKSGRGTITLRVHHHHAQKAARAAKAGGKAGAGKKKHHHDLVIHVTKDTVFHLGKNAGSFKDVHKGEHVAVQLAGGKKHDAKTVTVEAGKKNGKKAVARKNAAKKKAKT